MMSSGQCMETESDSDDDDDDDENTDTALATSVTSQHHSHDQPTGGMYTFYHILERITDL